MMTDQARYDEIEQTLQTLQDGCQQLAQIAPLNAEQHADLAAITQAVDKLRDEVAAHRATIQQPAQTDTITLQHIRHNLRNHLNIVVGFTRFWVRELPDNLLLSMVTIRQMHEAGNALMEQVDTIR